jgi:hypothetical protein
MLEICASGSVGGEGGNILAYPAVEPLRLEAGEAVGDGLELLADRLKVIQALVESEVLEIVGAELVTQECGELLVLLQEGRDRRDGRARSG